MRRRARLVALDGSDLPVSTTSLPRGAGASDEDLPGKAFHARNDYGTRDFGGAAPPPGDPPHRYIFAVHAVDVESLGLTPDVTPAVVAGTLQSHTLARATLRTIYALGAADRRCVGNGDGALAGRCDARET